MHAGLDEPKTVHFSFLGDLCVFHMEICTFIIFICDAYYEDYRMLQIHIKELTVDKTFLEERSDDYGYM